MVKHTKQLVGNLPTSYLSVFGHFVGLVLKWLKLKCIRQTTTDMAIIFTLRIWSLLLEKSLLENFIFCDVLDKYNQTIC